MKKYVLDLSELFSDHRRKSCIGHRESWASVGCAVRTIRETFQIAHNLHICSEEGIFYPESESIDIILEEDVLKILPSAQSENNKSHTQDERHETNALNALQESSTYEDIESVLLELPKPKRRRVRKRKIKQSDTEKETPDQSSPPLKHKVPRKQHVEQTEHIESEEAQPSEDKDKDHESDLPYRNLSQTMKARVVRAVSPTTLNPAQSANENVSCAEALAESLATPIEENQSVLKTKPKARVVRAIAKGNTLEIKQEQLESIGAASDVSTLQQLVQDKTTAIALDLTTPTLVTREEATHDTAIPAV
uniref:Coilin N-terminal domain-containing protein n=1 Tax=Anopheles farauti TaxID=69004 RepID=A0A182QM43_9DIPT